MIILSTKINFWSFSFKRLTYNFVWIDFEKSKWHKCIKPQMRPFAIPNFEKIHMILNSIHANTAIVISIYKLIWNESRVVFAVWTRQREIKLRYNSLSFSSWWLLLTGEDVGCRCFRLFSPALALMMSRRLAGNSVVFAGLSMLARLLVPVRPGPSGD